MLGSQQEQMRSEMAELKAFLVEQAGLGTSPDAIRGKGKEDGEQCLDSGSGGLHQD